LNLPVGSSAANESILRVAAPKRLLQHYLPEGDVVFERRQRCHGDEAVPISSPWDRNDPIS
jgi:hypothetical protein